MRVVGVDEAGRGPLAGPVVAAAVWLDPEQMRSLWRMGLRDSKKLSPSRREKLFGEMLRRKVVWRAQAASAARIDRDNILQASLWAMKRSVEKLPFSPDLAVVDGNCLIPGLGCPQKTVIKGDSRVLSVAAASVVAKVLRDRVMVTLHAFYPEYGFAQHKGYPTKMHREVLQRLGPTSWHRRSFSF